MRVIFPGEPPHGPWCGARVVPMRCRTCRTKIFWFSCEHGSSVLFDALGSPWPRHDCDGRVSRTDVRHLPDSDLPRSLEARIRELETLLKRACVVGGAREP